MLSEQTQRELRRWIPDYLRVSNPVDSGSAPTAGPHGRALIDTMLADPQVGVLVCPVVATKAPDGSTSPIASKLVADLIDASQATDKMICVIWGSPTCDEPEYRALLDAGIATFRTFDGCFRALSALFSFRSRPGAAGEEGSGAIDADRAVRARSLVAGGSASTEHGAKALLDLYGIDIPREVVAADAAAACDAARSFDGEVVLKIASPDILHKSDLGLVQVGVPVEQVEEVATELLARAAAAAPMARVDGVLVSERVQGELEVVVGLVRDVEFGHAVMVGLGGIFLEVTRDVAFRVPPFSRDEAHRMLASLRCYSLLEGARGRPPLAVERIVDVVMAVQALAAELGDLVVELDINPLIVSGDRAVAADALVVARSD